MILLTVLSVNLLFISIRLANGQCTVDSSKESETVLLDESLLENIKKQTQKLENLYHSLSLRLEEIDGRFNFENGFSKRVQCETLSTVCDCSEVKAMGYRVSGVYRLYVIHDQKRVYKDAYCDLSTTTNDWTVFQRRVDGSEAFSRGWNDYTSGFGNPNGEFWLGNEFLHLMTSKKSYRLRIDLEDFEGENRYAEYSIFNIDSSTDKYRLSIGSFSGDAGDSFTHHNGLQFSTKEVDNDRNSAGSCAAWGRAGWWFNNCIGSNLNGLYYGGNYSEWCSWCSWEGVTWQSWRGTTYSLKKTEMKISPVN